MKQFGFLLRPIVGVSNSAKESKSWLPMPCDCYWATTCFCFFPAGQSLSDIALMAFGIQHDFLLAIAVMVLNIARSLRISVVPDGVANNKS